MSFSPSIRQIFRQVFSGVNDTLRVNGIIDSKIDNGLFYTVREYFSSIGNGDFAEILIVSGNEALINTEFGANSSGDFLFEVYEGVVDSDLGVEITPTNNNRQSTNIASGSFYREPIISSDGFKLFEALIPGASGPIKSDAKFIFKKNTKYLMRATNVSGGNEKCGIMMGFYET